MQIKHYVLHRLILFEVVFFISVRLFDNDFFLYLDSSKVRLKRDVPRVLVTSGSRRESPVRNSSVPGALSESSGLSLRRCFSLLFLSLFHRRARGGDLLHLGILSTCFSTTYLPTCILRTYVHAHTSLSALVIFATSYRRQLLNRAPRRDHQRNFRTFRQDKRKYKMLTYSIAFDIQDITFVALRTKTIFPE